MKMSCGFWNRLVKQSSAPFLRAAFAENLQLSIVDGVDKYWCAEMLKCLGEAVPDYAEQVKAVVRSRSFVGMQLVDVETVLAAWSIKWNECWQDLPEDPRYASSEKVVCSTYDKWMSECISQPAKYVNFDSNFNTEHLMDLVRLRVGGHWLNVVTGRWIDGGRDRRSRLCWKCAGCVVEDEKHFMMECPAYQDIRDNFQDLYNDSQGDMRKLMCHPKQHLLAKLVHQLRTFRDEDRLLHFDVHLDSFDSDIELNPLDDEDELVEVHQSGNIVA
jgi:hypothetical protein